MGTLLDQDRQHGTQAPPLPLVNDFCQRVADWLQKDPQNVAVVHCKAGKGRTGTMICSYLVYAVRYACICHAACCTAWRVLHCMELLSMHGNRTTLQNSKPTTLMHTAAAVQN